MSWLVKMKRCILIALLGCFSLGKHANIEPAYLIANHAWLCFSSRDEMMEKFSNMAGFHYMLVRV